MSETLTKTAKPARSGRPGASSAADIVLRSARWKPAEYVFWVVALAVALLLPRQLLLLNEIAILALFALSLDLILGYAGIVSLGHAAFLGLGAYTAGILAQQGWNDPLLGLGAAAVLSAALGFATSFLLLRGTDLTRLMVTLGIALMLGELANRFSSLTGGADGLQGVTVGPVLGVFAFDLFGRTAYLYSLTVLFVLFLLARRIVHSPFGLSLRAVKANPLRARSIGISVNVRLVAIYTIAAAYAGIAGALLAQTTQFVSLDVLEFHRSADVLLVLVIGGVGYLYGGILGAVIFKVMQDVLMSFTPQYWLFWIGLVLVVLVLTGRERVSEFLQGAVGRLFALVPGFGRRA
jgi:branched-chain amino acid transport system permease protein